MAELLVYFALLVIAMIVHEFSHGWMAYKLGDTTAKSSGRLTLNPLAHIDIWGTIVIPIIIFMTTGFFIAAAKPVPINYWSLRNPRRDIALIGASGPVSNFIFAVFTSMLIWFLPMHPIMSSILIKLVYINVMLGVFNLVPIPPLDGSRIILGLLPDELAGKYAQIEPYGLIIVMLLFFAGILSRIIWPVITSIMGLLRVPL